MAIRAKPTDRRITHHVSLTKDGVELGLILCDGRGKPDPRAIRQGTNPRTSLQIRQGDADYSDFELPYTPITQKEWSGGRGSEEFENDKSRYLDGRNASGVHGRVFLGPKLNRAVLYSGGMAAYLNGNVHFFEYKGAMYCVTQPDDGATAPKLFMNGLRGLGKAGSTVNGTVTNLDLTGFNLSGKLILITSGKGYNETQRWRKIASNTQGTSGGDTIVPTEAWLTAHDATTEFAILGMDTWTEITGHGLTKPVTSVLVNNATVYFAQGESTNIRRIRWYNNSGTWTMDPADDGSNKATLLRMLPRTSGGMRIWKVNNPENDTPTAAYATPVAWGSNLDFSTKPSELTNTADWPIQLTSANSMNNSRVNGIEAYGDPIIPWILKEDEIGSIENGIYSPVPITEMRAAKDDRNGRAHMQYGVYLFLNMLDGLERYYQNRLDDIGPNREIGFPFGRKGPIACMTPYPGQVFFSIDAGWTGYSSILAWNGIGFHEILRAECPNDRIRNMVVQVTPDPSEPDRLWFVYGGGIAYIHVSINPLSQPGFKYASNGHIQSGRLNGGFAEINKFWRAATVYLNKFSEKLYAKVSYRTSDGVSPRDNQNVATLDSNNYKSNITAFAKLSTWYLAGANGANKSAVLLSLDDGETFASEYVIDSSFNIVSCMAERSADVLVAVCNSALTQSKIYKLQPTPTLVTSYFATTDPLKINKILTYENYIIVLAGSKVYSSVDDGATWTEQLARAGYTMVDAFLEGDIIYVTHTNGTDTDIYYIGIYGNGLWTDQTPELPYWHYSGTISSFKGMKVVNRSQDHIVIGNHWIYGGLLGQYLAAYTIPTPTFNNLTPNGATRLMEQEYTLSDAICTANDGILVAAYQTANPDSIYGKARGFYYYSPDAGAHWLPYTPSEVLAATGGLYRIPDDKILFGGQSNAAGSYAQARIMQSESDSDWIQVDKKCNTKVTEVQLSADNDVIGQRLQYMVDLYTENELETPVLKAITIDAVTRLRGKKTWVLTFLVDDMLVDLQGKREDWTADDLISQLEEWADSYYTGGPVTMRFHHSIMDDKPVFLEYPVIQILESTASEDPHKVRLICSLTVTEA